MIIQLTKSTLFPYTTLFRSWFRRPDTYRRPASSATANDSNPEPGRKQQCRVALNRDERLERKSGVLDQSHHNQLVRTVYSEQQLPEWHQRDHLWPPARQQRVPSDSLAAKLKAE